MCKDSLVMSIAALHPCALCQTARVQQGFVPCSPKKWLRAARQGQFTQAPGPNAVQQSSVRRMSRQSSGSKAAVQVEQQQQAIQEAQQRLLHFQVATERSNADRSNTERERNAEKITAERSNADWGNAVAERRNVESARWQQQGAETARAGYTSVAMSGMATQLSQPANQQVWPL